MLRGEDLINDLLGGFSVVIDPCHRLLISPNLYFLAAIKK